MKQNDFNEKAVAKSNLFEEVIEPKDRLEENVMEELLGGGFINVCKSGKVEE